MVFKDKKFIFDSEVGCISICEFRVNRDLDGEIDFFLYKETMNEYFEYVNSWGEKPKPTGIVYLKHYKYTGEKPEVTVIKLDVPNGQPFVWSNR